MQNLDCRWAQIELLRYTAFFVHRITFDRRSCYFYDNTRCGTLKNESGLPSTQRKQVVISSEAIRFDIRTKCLRCAEAAKKQRLQVNPFSPIYAMLTLPLTFRF